VPEEESHLSRYTETKFVRRSASRDETPATDTDFGHDDEAHQDTKAEHEQTRRSHARKSREQKKQVMKCRKKKVTYLDLPKRILCDEVHQQTKAGDGHGLRPRQRSASRGEGGARAGATEPRAGGPRADDAGHEVPEEQSHISGLAETIRRRRRSTGRRDGAPRGRTASRRCRP
jgi:hypothetical protein